MPIASPVGLAVNPFGRKPPAGQIGVVGIGSSPQELDRYWHQQLEYLGRIVKDANIKPVE